MDESWLRMLRSCAANPSVFLVVLVLTPPPELGPPVRGPIAGEHERPELAEEAALDTFAAMTRDD
ncbi:hypothetical protein PV762_07675 [Mitsuaria sp. CC2]